MESLASVDPYCLANNKGGRDEKPFYSMVLWNVSLILLMHLIYPSQKIPERNFPGNFFVETPCSRAYDTGISSVRYYPQ
jgi:hypothetical protein